MFRLSRLRLPFVLLTFWAVTTVPIALIWLLTSPATHEQLVNMWIEERAHYLARTILPDETAKQMTDLQALTNVLRQKAGALELQLAIFDAGGRVLVATTPGITRAATEPSEVQLCRNSGRPVFRWQEVRSGGHLRCVAAFPVTALSAPAVLWLEQEIPLSSANLSGTILWSGLRSIGWGSLLGAMGWLVVGLWVDRVLAGLSPEKLVKERGPSVPRWYPQEIVQLAQQWRDYTVQRENERKRLRQIQAELEAVLEHLADGILILDREGRGQKWNQQAAQLLRFPPHLSPGQLILSERIRHPAFPPWWQRVLSGEASPPLRLTHEFPEQHLELRAVPLRFDDTGDVHFLVVVRDVTRTEVLDRVRRDFVANVSHELKTPLTTMKGFLETLLDGAIEEPDQARHFTQIVFEQTERLERIVDDLLVLTRLDSATDQPLERQQVKASALIQGAIEQCQLAAERKNMTLKAEIVTDPDLDVNPRLFQMAIVNLIDNAIKYSDPGKTITVRVEMQDKEILFSVIDEGWGIESRHLPRIFERFYCVDPGRSRELGGTGLGLSIVKHVAQVHGGYVTVTSEVGRGSTFTIHLPK
ncbi:ATP-binding protein [Thermogutta terrifontis]|uniref:ATP-binding protein n=1 Tax=Thermogutta terrifontis TaxID=1331910 RepID=UPI000BA892BA|nr:ATP-binding protein [Thermogutta terrifontis]